MKWSQDFNSTWPSVQRIRMYPPQVYIWHNTLKLWAEALWVQYLLFLLEGSVTTAESLSSASRCDTPWLSLENTRQTRDAYRLNKCSGENIYLVLKSYAIALIPVRQPVWALRCDRPLLGWLFISVWYWGQGRVGAENNFGFTAESFNPPWSSPLWENCVICEVSVQVLDSAVMLINCVVINKKNCKGR